jgi:ubiquinone/menaquinone biosynthesis C-methylase UbiE
MQPQSDEAFKPNTQVYANMFNNEHDHWWYKGLRGLVAYWLAKLDVKTVLDAGCGTGENMRVLASKKYKVWGCDISDEAVTYCKQRGFENVLKVSVSKLPYQDSFFDCIFCTDVLQCLSPGEYLLALKEFKRCLKPRGYLVINTAALPFLFSNHDIAWRVKRRFLIKDMENDLKREGLEIIKSTHRVFFLFPFAVLFKYFSKIYYRNSDDAPDSIDKVNVLMNSVFTALMSVENYLIRLVSLPIGTSIFIVARKR